MEGDQLALGLVLKTGSTARCGVRCLHSPPNLQYNDGMKIINTIISKLTKKPITQEPAWCYAVVEDNRTMLVGRGLTDTEAISSMFSAQRRDKMIHPAGILSVVFPPGVVPTEDIPENIIEAICEHLGVPPPKK